MFLLKTKYLKSIKNNVAQWKTEMFQPIISSVWFLFENSIIYKYQVTIIGFDSFLLSSKILDTKKFEKKQIDLALTSAPFDKCYSEPLE